MDSPGGPLLGGTTYSMTVSVDHGEMELEYNHLYNYVYAAFSRYPTGSSKN